jgi:hypothetical protein
MNEELRVFSKIPKELFYIDNTNEGYKNSILNKLNDSKVLLVLHYLYTLGNRYNITATTIDYLLSNCSYKAIKDNKRDIKSILKYLKQIKLINYFSDNYNSNELIEIDISNLINSSNFVTLEQNEINILETKTDNKKEFINLLKIYLYIKARAYKRNNDSYGLDIEGGRTQTTYCSYDNISLHTNIGQGQIKKYIDKLQDIKLIKYANLGMKSIEVNGKVIIDECINIYAIVNLCNNSVDAELKEGLKQQEYTYKEKGYKIIKVKTNNKNDNKVINGRKGYLIKKQNNNTITNKEIKELELINTDIEKYKKLYLKKLKDKNNKTKK